MISIPFVSKTRASVARSALGWHKFSTLQGARNQLGNSVLFCNILLHLYLAKNFVILKLPSLVRLSFEGALCSRLVARLWFVVDDMYFSSFAVGDVRLNGGDLGDL